MFNLTGFDVRLLHDDFLASLYSWDLLVQVICPQPVWPVRTTQLSFRSCHHNPNSDVYLGCLYAGTVTTSRRLISQESGLDRSIQRWPSTHETHIRRSDVLLRHVLIYIWFRWGVTSGGIEGVHEKAFVYTYDGARGYYSSITFLLHTWMLVFFSFMAVVWYAINTPTGFAQPELWTDLRNI